MFTILLVALLSLLVLMQPVMFVLGRRSGEREGKLREAFRVVSSSNSVPVGDAQDDQLKELKETRAYLDELHAELRNLAAQNKALAYKTKTKTTVRRDSYTCVCGHKINSHRDKGKGACIVSLPPAGAGNVCACMFFVSRAD